MAMAEPDPGRGQGGRRRSGDVATTFKVDDSSLRKLNDLWTQLVKNVKAFNAELKKIDPTNITAAAQATARLAGAAGGGGATGGVGGNYKFTRGNTLPPITPGGRPSGYPPPPPGGAPSPPGPPQGPGGPPDEPPNWARRAGFGAIGLMAAYGGSHKQNMMDAERLAQYMTWGMSGRSEQRNEDIRRFWFGGGSQRGLTGMQNTQDALRGIATLQGNIGYGFGANEQRMYTAAGRVGNLMGSYEQGARVQSALASSGTFYNMMALGIRTTNRDPEDIARAFLMRVFRGRMPTQEEVASGMRQGMPLRASMDAFQLDPETQEWIAKYGMVSGKLGGMTGLSGRDLADRMKQELGTTGGATPEGKSAIGATAYDAQRRMGQKQAEVEQEIADVALPAMRTAFNTMTGVLNTIVIPGLTDFGGALGAIVGTGAGLGAAGAGTAAAVGGFAGGLLPTMFMAWAMNRRRGGGGGGPGGGGPGGGGPRGGGIFGLGGPLRGLARFAGFGALGMTGGALAGGLADAAGGPSWLGSGLRWGGTGAGIGAAVGGVPGAIIGGGIGAVAGIGKSLFFDRGGPPQDGAMHGSREESDVVEGALARSAPSGAPSGSSAGSSAPETSSSSASPSVASGGSTAGATRRGAAALAWMLRQSKNPSKSWYNLCLQDVRMSLGVGAKYHNATTAWMNTKKRHKGTPPPGVPVWWTGGDGHVALSAGGGMVWSNDILRRGKIDKVSIAYINKKWNKPYQGWSEDINDVDVYDPVGGNASMTKSSGGNTRAAAVGGPVSRWADEVASVLQELGMPGDWQDEVLHRINQESSGRPEVVNTWDSNWRRGTPSVGLMQVIGPTFRAYAGPYRNTGPFKHGTSVNPHANIYAGLNYAQKRYGRSNIPKVMLRPGGYASGALEVQGDQMALIHHGEMILPAQQADRVRKAVRKREATPAAATTRSVTVHLTAHLHMQSGVTQADAERFLDMVVRRMENDERLAAVGVGD